MLSKEHKLLIFIFLFNCCILSNYAQQTFSSLDSLLHYVNLKSTGIKSYNLKYEQAKKAKLAAVLGIVDPTGNVSLNVTNNTKLPVSLFPAEAFGGQPGTYKEVQTGIKYTNNLNENIDIKLINIAGWQSFKLSEINIESSSLDVKTNLKTTYENIASAYYNILNLQMQLKSTKENQSASDSIFQIVLSKFKQGLVKQQDVNDAKVNVISTDESFNQIIYLIQQQYMALKMLCDIPEKESININEAIIRNDVEKDVQISANKISYNSSLLKEKAALSNYRQTKLSVLPVVSAFASNSNQQFGSQFSLFDNNIKWINSNYIGIKAVWQIPTANSITQISKAKYDYLIAKENTKHSFIKAAVDLEQLDLDYQKAKSQMLANQQIYDLRKDSYEKNLNAYVAGIMSLDQTLNSFNAMVNSNYNFISSEISVLLSKAKIDINNNIK